MPQALPFIMMGATLLSTAAGVSSSMEQGNMAQQAANQQAHVQRMQGELVELNARSEASELTRESVRLQSRQMAQAAGAGISLDSGSFMALIADSANRINLDREQVLRTGRLNRAAAESGASMSSFEGLTRKKAGSAQAMGTLFNGLSSSMSVANKAGWFN